MDAALGLHFPRFCLFRLFSEDLPWLIGLECKPSPILRQGKNLAPKRWRHFLGTSLTLIGVVVINLIRRFHDVTGTGLRTNEPSINTVPALCQSAAYLSAQSPHQRPLP